MNIVLHEVKVRDLVNGYHDDGEGGVRGLSGHLDIRPPFQREFVYKDEQRDAVIETINKGFPLNVMYWAVRQDEKYEVIDGQQRTISVAQYVSNDYSIDGLYFNNLQNNQQERILDYLLQVYICEGSASEKLDWFRIINIAGEKLTDQELRNAVYAGPWVSDAKQYFSRHSGPAYAVGSKYVNGSPIRQDYLETAIKWIKDKSQTVEQYMGEHQHDKTAIALWNHFQSVMEHVKAVFPKYHKTMKGVDWGMYYEHLRNENLDPKALAAEVERLILDDDVQRNAGIYPYLLTNDKKHLNLRAFTPAQKQRAFNNLEIAGVCRNAGKRA